MTQFSYVLAIDAAMNGCGVCVYNAQADKFDALSEPMMRGHSERLMPMVQDMLAKAGLSYAELNAIIVTRGPGAFTGVRIGLSAARSLGMALGVPVLGITTLQTLALAYFEKEVKPEYLAVVVDTKRQDFYLQVFDGAGHALSEPEALEIEAIDLAPGTVLIGDAAERLMGLADGRNWVFKPGYDLPDAGVMARAAAQGAGVIQDPEPLYLRPPDVSQSKKIQRVMGD